ncbi:MAG TPA: cytochrome c [Vicinamibacterales bacterium]|nr:cytochrome c [Vicinamibacterales bacterium]
MGSRSKTMRGVAAAIAVASLAIVSTTVSVLAQAKKGGDPKAAAVKNPVQPTPKSIAAGQQAYNRACRQCHGPKGLGDGPLAPKNPSPADLTDAEWTYGSSDGEIFAIISNGVGGDSEMKGHRSEMTATDMWNIVNFLRSIGPQPAK